MKRPRSLVKWAVLLVAASVAFYLCWQLLRPFLNVIAWSIVLTVTFNPVQQHLVKRTGRHSVSALLSSLLVVLTILVPVLFISALIVNESLALKDSLQVKFQQGFDPNAIESVRNATDWLSRHITLDKARIMEAIRQQVSHFAQLAAQLLLTFVGNVSSLIVFFVFTTFTMYYLFRDGARMAGKIPDLLPLERSQSEGLMTRVRNVITGSIYGVLVISVIQGVLGALAFWFLSIPSPALWGFVMALTSMIPLLGAAGVWVPAAIYLLFSGHWEKALIMVIIGGAVISSVDNFLRPKLVGEKVKLHELVMFFSVLGGLQLFGVLGIVGGPVVFAAAGSLLDALRSVETKADSPGATVSN